MAQFRDKTTGEVITVPDESVGDFLRSVDASRFQASADTRIPVFDPDDPEKVGTTTAGELQSVLEGGFELASQDQIARDIDRRQFGEGVGNAARAFAEGFANDALLGAGDAALIGAGISTPEGLRKRAEFNPEARTAGEVAGLVAPVAVSGGAGLFARGAATGTRALAGQAAKQALKVTPTSLLARAGRASEAKIAEALGGGLGARVAATATVGAAEGAAFNVGTGLSQVVRDGEEALGDSETVAEFLVSRAKEGALLGAPIGGAIVAAPALVSAASRKTRQAVANQFRKVVNEDTIAKKLDEFAFAATRGRKKFVQEAEKFQGKNGVAEIGRVMREDGIVRPNSTVKSIADEAFERQRFYGTQIDDALRQTDELRGPLSRSDVFERIERDIITPLETSALATDKRIAKTVRDEIEEFFIVGPEELGVQELQQFRVRFGKVKNLARRAQSEQTEVLFKADRVMEDTIVRSTREASDAVGDLYKESKRRWSAMRVVTDAAADTIERDAANRFFSLSDMQALQIGGIGEAIVGGALDVGSLGMGMVFGLVNKAFRERGSAVIAGTGNHIGNLSRINSATRGVDQITNSSISKIVDTMKGVRKVGKRAIVPLATLTREGETKQSFYKRKRDQVVDLSSNPAKMAARAEKHFNQAAPNVSAAIGAKGVRAANFLRSKLPAERPGSIARPDLDETQRVSDAEMNKFLRYVKAVENPLAVFEDAAEGDITREGVEALREVYPRMYEKLVTRLSESLAELKTPPPMSSLVQLSIILGQPMHFSMRSEFVIAHQQMFAAAQQPQEDARAPSARRDLNQSQSLLTGSQAAEAV